MIVVEYSDKRPLVILHDSKNGSRNEDVTERDGEFDTSFRKRSCKTAFQNRKYDSSDLSLVNDRIDIAKHDFKQYHWKIVTDKGNDTGIHLIIKKQNWEGKLHFNNKSTRKKYDGNL